MIFHSKILISQVYELQFSTGKHPTEPIQLQVVNKKGENEQAE